MIDGPTPLHLIEKLRPAQAQLIVDAIATILTGAGARHDRGATMRNGASA
jgi:hypothetical protein